MYMHGSISYFLIDEFLIIQLLLEDDRGWLLSILFYSDHCKSQTSAFLYKANISGERCDPYGPLVLLVVALSYYNNQDTLSEGKCRNKDNTNMIQEFYTVNTSKCLIWFLTPDFYRSDILYLNMNFHFQYKP